MVNFRDKFHKNVFFFHTKIVFLRVYPNVLINCSWSVHWELSYQLSTAKRTILFSFLVLINLALHLSSLCSTNNNEVYNHEMFFSGIELYLLFFVPGHLLVSFPVQRYWQAFEIGQRRQRWWQRRSEEVEAPQMSGAERKLWVYRKGVLAPLFRLCLSAKRAFYYEWRAFLCWFAQLWWTSRVGLNCALRGCAPCNYLNWI